MHDHDHDHDDHDHDHGHSHGHAPPQKDHDAGPVGAYEVLEEAVRSLLIEKGVFTPQEIAAQVDLMDSRSPALGAKVVAKAWVDPAYKRRLLKDTRAALAELGIDIGTLAEFRTVENTAKVHNVIVCTLCSCYPKMLLGIPPAWYKSLAYRSRTVVDPRGVLAEFGVELPAATEVRVHDSTADLRYIVLPMRLKGTRGWSEAELAAIVTRDSMIGTAIPIVPPKPTVSGTKPKSAKRPSSYWGDGPLSRSSGGFLERLRPRPDFPGLACAAGSLSLARSKLHSSSISRISFTSRALISAGPQTVRPRRSSLISGIGTPGVLK
jgi:nitrile hydratase subunit alpha